MEFPPQVARVVAARGPAAQRRSRYPSSGAKALTLGPAWCRSGGAGSAKYLSTVCRLRLSCRARASLLMPLSARS